MSKPFLAGEFEDVLSVLEEQSLLRRVRSLEDLQGNSAVYQGRRLTLFCSNDYLGLTKHPAVVSAFRETASLYGVGAGAARLIAGSLRLHDKLEADLAAYKQKEAALVFSAGYLANLGVLSALASKEDLIIMDKLCHASLIDGARLSGAAVRVFPHKNYERCEKLLDTEKNFRRKILVTDAVFSMDGDLADLARLAVLKRKYQTLLVVDDAHGMGVLGPEGEGACIDPAWNSEIDVITGTFSKSAGGLGGYAVTSAVLREYLVNHARSFIFATAMPPAMCGAMLKSLEIMRYESALRDTLLARQRQMTEGLRNLGFSVAETLTPIIPIIIGSERTALALAEALFEKGFWVPAIRYPTVAKNHARLRVTVNALHSEEQVSIFLDALALIKRDMQTDNR